jgi:hypothetical protein
MSEHQNEFPGLRSGATGTQSCRSRPRSAIVHRRSLIRSLAAATCILTLLLSTTTPALASNGADPTSVVVDVLVARPISLVATIAGSALFVISLPIAAASHSVATTSETLVCGPARDLLSRPVGDLNDWFSY